MALSLIGIGALLVMTVLSAAARELAELSLTDLDRVPDLEEAGKVVLAKKPAAKGIAAGLLTQDWPVGIWAW